MHGITLTCAPSDWEILQQTDGAAKVTLKGSYTVHPAAIEVGVSHVRPVYRVMREEDNTCVIPWTEMNHVTNKDFSGTFIHTFSLPSGGLYRIDTSLETKSTVPELTWMYRGDCVLHLGVGNLFIIAGQSNSSGYSRDYAFDPPSLNVHLFRNRSRWDLASHPMNESTLAGSLPNEEMGIPGVSPYLSFGRNFAELSGCPVGLIQTSLGGSSLSRWMPQTGDLYGNLIDKIRLTGGKYAGILWYQGCSDTTWDFAVSYKNRFAEFVKAVRQETGYEIPFFTFQLNRQIGGLYDACWGMVREAQRQAAQELSRVYILPTTNCPLSDSIHNSAHANVMLGEKLSRLCAHVLLGKPEFFAPELADARLISKDVLQLTFSHMSQGFTVYSSTGKDSGFSLEDNYGEIQIIELHSSREDKNSLRLFLERSPGENARLSFCWEADPTRIPPVDEVTYLPPLSFYQIPILDSNKKHQEDILL